MDTSKLSSREILALIKQEIGGMAQTPERGYKTTAEWAREWDLSVIRSSQIIRQAFEAGLMERRDYRTQCASTVRKVPHYAYRAKAKPGKLPAHSR